MNSLRFGSFFFPLPSLGCCADTMDRREILYVFTYSLTFLNHVFSSLIINAMQLLFENIGQGCQREGRRYRCAFFPRLRPTCQQVFSRLHRPYCNKTPAFSTLVVRVRAPRLSLLLAWCLLCQTLRRAEAPSAFNRSWLSSERTCHFSSCPPRPPRSGHFRPTPRLPQSGAGDKRAWDGLC